MIFVMLQTQVIAELLCLRMEENKLSHFRMIINQQMKLKLIEYLKTEGKFIRMLPSSCSLKILKLV